MLAERCRIGRDYANPGDYDCRFVGLNARMSELHAAVALASFADLDKRLDRRNVIAEWYRSVLADIPGISFPRVPKDDWSTYKDLTILVEPEWFGCDAKTLAAELAPEGIETRRYYSPPVHVMKAYRSTARSSDDLRNTDLVAGQVVTLPLWVGMTRVQTEMVAWAIRRIHGSHVSNLTQPQSS